MRISGPPRWRNFSVRMRAACTKFAHQWSCGWALYFSHWLRETPPTRTIHSPCGTLAAGIGRARASAKITANERNRFVITAEQHYLCCRMARATRCVQARNSLVSNVLKHGESVTMVTSPEPALKPQRRGIEAAVILALSFVAIFALHGKMQPAVLRAETGYYQVIAHTSPRHERTLLRGFWTTSSHGLLHTSGIYLGVFICQTRWTSPELVAKQAAFSGRFAHLRFFRSHSSRRRTDRRASFRHRTPGGGHDFNFRGATPDAQPSGMALSWFANRVDDFCGSHWLGFGAAAGFTQQGSSSLADRADRLRLDACPWSGSGSCYRNCDCALSYSDRSNDWLLHGIQITCADSGSDPDFFSRRRLPSHARDDHVEQRAS